MSDEISHLLRFDQEAVVTIGRAKQVQFLRTRRQIHEHLLQSHREKPVRINSYDDERRCHIAECCRYSPAVATDVEQ